MDYDLLLEGCCELGCELLACGAEIYRVEDTVHRLLAAYNISGEVFAIPNCLIVSIADGEGQLHTRMHRASPPSTDVALLESYNALSRRLCANPPRDPGELLRQVYIIKEETRTFPLPLLLFGFFIGSFFFTLFFGGGIVDAIVGGLCGLIAGLSTTLLGRIHCNFFIATVISGFFLAALSYVICALSVPINLQAVISGGIMALVPGLMFTNFLSDLLTGDVIAGLSTFVRAMLCAAALALGTGLAMVVCSGLDTSAASELTVERGAIFRCLFSAVACYGYCFVFNIRGGGALLCCLGGGVGWLVYELLLPLANGSVYFPTFAAAVVVACYAEVMARVRKCPATAYIVVSFFPLVPGRTIYQALDYGLHGELELFWGAFFRTVGIAGCLAIASLVVTSCVRILYRLRRRNL